MSAPEVSILIPIYNEEAILKSAVYELLENLAGVDFSYELILSENGSKDGTIQIARQLAADHPQIRVLTVGEPNYGRALKEAIRQARGQFVICDEIDLCDVAFYRTALEKLRTGRYDLVVGSKRAPGANDRRPLYRRLATQVLNGMLRIAVGFKGSDTHGLKAFRREALLPLVDACVVERDMFASEFVVRVHRSEHPWTEVPIDLHEKRPPSVHLFKRVPHVLRSMVRLTSIIRRGRDL